MIAKANTGEILQRLHPNTQFQGTYRVVFAAGSKQIVAVSGYGEIVIWEGESSASAMKFVKKHSSAVTGIAPRIDDEEISSSSNDGTLRIRESW